MLLVLAIVQDQDTGSLLDSLIAHHYRATIIPAVSGFLQEQNVAVMAVIEGEQLGDALEIIQANCHTRPHHVNPIPNSDEAADMVFLASPVDVEVGAASVFVFDIVRFERFLGR